MKLFLLYHHRLCGRQHRESSIPPLFRRTVMSTVVTYLTMFLMGLVSVILGIYIMTVQYNGPGNPGIPFILYINPAVGLTDILVTEPGDFCPRSWSIYHRGSRRLLDSQLHSHADCCSHTFAYQCIQNQSGRVFRPKKRKEQKMKIRYANG